MEMERTIRKLDDLTEDDLERLDQLSERLRPAAADLLIDMLKRLEPGTPENAELGMISVYEHSLQCATRAYQAGEDDEMVVVALLHDVADWLSPYNHDDVGAELLRPYVSDGNYWLLKHHAIFQLFHARRGTDQDRNVRERYVDHPAYDKTVCFCAKYDQVSFDPDYETMPLSVFEPIVRRVVTAERAQTFESQRFDG